MPPLRLLGALLALSMGLSGTARTADAAPPYTPPRGRTTPDTLPRADGHANFRNIITTYRDGTWQFVMFAFGALERAQHYFRDGEPASVRLYLECADFDHSGRAYLSLSFSSCRTVDIMTIQWRDPATNIPYRRKIKYVGRARHDVTYDVSRIKKHTVEGHYVNWQGRKLAINAIYRHGKVIEKLRVPPPPFPTPPPWRPLPDGRLLHANGLDDPGENHTPAIDAAAIDRYVTAIVGPRAPCPCGRDHIHPFGRPAALEPAK